MTAGVPPEVDPRRWRALWICLIAGFMTLLDVSIVNVALPSMERGIGATPSDVSWVVSGYALTFGLALVPAGRLGDDFGRKRMFLIGLLLFVATSALAGAAQDATWLVVARLLQGIAGGILNPQVIGMIQQLFTGKERGKAFGWFGATVGLSTAVGPLLGGLLIQGFGAIEGWRFVFYVNLPIGIAAVLFGLWLLPKDRVRAAKRAPDLLGTVLLGAAVVTVMLPLVEAEEATGTPQWWLMGIGAALLVLFLLWERFLGSRGRHPLVNLRLLTVRSYAMGSLLGLVYFAGFTGIFLVITLFFQQGLGYSPLQSGLASLPFALGSAISPTIGGRIVHRYGRPMVVIGILLVAIGLSTTAVLVLTTGGSGFLLAAPLLVAGFGSGLVIAPNSTLALEEVPPAEGGTAAGVLQTGQRIGSAVGTAIGGSLFFSQLSASHGDFHDSAAHGLFGSAGLVILALLVGVADIVLSRRRRRRRTTARVAAITGTTTDGAGTAVAATVTLTAPDGTQLAKAETDEQGRFGVDPGPGRFLMLITAIDRRPVARWVEVAGEPVTVDTVLESTARLTGRVHAAHGPVPDVCVSLLDHDGRVLHSAVTGVDGSYLLEDLTPGRYTLVATSYAPNVSKVRLSGGEHARHDPVLEVTSG
ncbi:MFS transporter [Sciscionella sediminilitoris]|uniref:MFS transporter n=1 Tax=Sciscionella sediminilitoris TaxID=1445613 RepID=UPI0004DF0AAF|nr:MFS transporter [Sciscionella sp. SE31]